MNRSPAASIGALLVIALGSAVAMCSEHVRAQDHDTSHAKFHDFYRDWLRPDTGTSCCNMRQSTPDGDMTGDCRVTRFQVGKDGHWQALLDDGKTWISVPDDKVIREKNPDPSGVDGHLCENVGVVYCAVPPTGAL